MSARDAASLSGCHARNNLRDIWRDISPRVAIIVSDDYDQRIPPLEERETERDEKILGVIGARRGKFAEEN